MMTDVGVRPNLFGAESALSNGVVVDVLNTATTTQELDFTDGQNLKRNSDFALLAGTDISLDTVSGSSDDMVSSRWTIAKAGGLLILSSDQALRIQIQDDLTGLTSFMAMAQGTIVKATA